MSLRAAARLARVLCRVCAMLQRQFFDPPDLDGAA